jgi:hypothetical protein
MMLSDVAFSDESNKLSKHDFEHLFRDLKAEKGVTEDTDVDAEGLKELVTRYKKLRAPAGRARVPPGRA